MNTDTPNAWANGSPEARSLRVNWVEERPFEVEVRQGEVSQRIVLPKHQLRLEAGVIAYPSTGEARRFGRRRTGAAAWIGKVLFNVPWL